jgi:hypothetical protein
MSSLRRQIASRANGARSRGPVTPEGKARSAGNAVRHGILAKCIVLRSESRDAFQELMDGFISRFQPADEIEMNLVEEMAAAVWRTRRFWAIETRIIDDAIASTPPNDAIGRMAAGFSALAAGPQLGLLNRYEARLHRIYQRAFDNLLLLQSGRGQPGACQKPEGPAASNEPDPSNEPSEPNEPIPDSEHGLDRIPPGQSPAPNTAPSPDGPSLHSSGARRSPGSAAPPAGPADSLRPNRPPALDFA